MKNILIDDYLLDKVTEQAIIVSNQRSALMVGHC